MGLEAISEKRRSGVDLTDSGGIVERRVSCELPFNVNFDRD